MGRTILAEESLQDKLSALAKVGSFQIGLLIGQNAEEKDFIAHIAPTPTLDEGDLSSEDEDDPSLAKEVVRSKAPDSLYKIVDAVMAQHTRQVIRMLPGGLDIIGIYVVTTQGDFNSSANVSKLRSVLVAIHRTASKILMETAESRTEKIILHVCTQSLKMLCKTMEVSPTAPGLLSNADIKFQRGGVKWHEILYSYNINLKFWLPIDKSPQSLYKMVLTFIKQWVDSVTESLILIDSEFPNDDDLLDAEADEKPAKKKGGGRGVMDLTSQKIFRAEILDSCVPLIPFTKKDESSGSVCLMGAIAGLAFVHSKVTLREAKAAVLVDLVRTVVARWEMHCDSLIEEPPSHLMGPIIHEAPRRVFLKGLPVSFCDYLFPGDTKADACQSANELLNIKVRDEHVDDSVETFKEVEALEESGAGAGWTERQISGDANSWFYSRMNVFLPFVIAIFAVGIFIVLNIDWAYFS